jgi:hypothetical protein
MKTITVASDSGPTYASFRRQVACFVAEVAGGQGGPQLEARLKATLKTWHAQGYPRNWIAQARADVLKALCPDPTAQPVAANQPALASNSRGSSPGGGAGGPSRSWHRPSDLGQQPARDSWVDPARGSAR